MFETMKQFYSLFNSNSLTGQQQDEQFERRG